MDSRLVDATGAPLRDAIRWSEGSWGVCAVEDCHAMATMFGWLRYGGSLGYLCAEHRADPDACDALIIAAWERRNAGARTNDTAAGSP